MPDRMVTIAAFNTLIEASMAKNRLEAEGIRVFLADAGAVGMVWHLTSAFGGIKLQVMDDDAGRAVSILEAADAEPISDGQSLPDESEDDFEQDIDEIYEDKYISPTEELVTRAFRAAILGLIFLPLQFYSVWLLLRIVRDGEPLSSSERKRVLLTVILNAWMIVLFMFLFWTAYPR